MTGVQTCALPISLTRRRYKPGRRQGVLGKGRAGFYLSAMSTVKEIESAIQKLPPADVKELLDWIQDYLEDELEMTDDFKASIQRGKDDLTAGRVRTR